MRSIHLALSGVAAAIVGAGVAYAAQFAVGDRVVIGSTQAQGTVIEVGQQLRDGGTMIKVHVDSLSAAFPNVGSWYDTAMSRVMVTGHGAVAPQAAPGAAAAPAKPAAGASGGTASAAPGKVPASAQSCQQAIRANYPPAGADQTITVTFLAYEMAAPKAHEAVYANDWQGRGHSVQATPVHAKYTVLTHYADPKADDALRTYDAQFMCYRTATSGELVVEMVSRLPGGERATYIKKQ